MSDNYADKMAAFKAVYASNRGITPKIRRYNVEKAKKRLYATRARSLTHVQSYRRPRAHHERHKPEGFYQVPTRANGKPLSKLGWALHFQFTGRTEKSYRKKLWP